MLVLTHPGELRLTKKAIDICDLPGEARILDVGCGYGDTAGFLTDEYGFCVTGIDKSKEAITHARERNPSVKFLKGDGQFLDFESMSFDCVLMECTLSLMSNPAEAVHEAYCVLKKGGYLIISDLYLPNPTDEDKKAVEESEKKNSEQKTHGSCDEERQSEHTIEGALVLDGIHALLDELCFEVIAFDDRKADLESFAASMILNGQSVDECRNATINGSKISYFMLIAQKNRE